MASSAGDTLRDSATGSSPSSEFTPTPSYTPLPTSASSPTQSSKAIITAMSTALEPGAEDHATMHFDDPPIPLHKHAKTASDSASTFASSADSRPEKPLDILYRAKCRQKGRQDKIFYNDTPFKGIHWESINDQRLGITDESVISVIEIEIELSGRDVSGRSSDTKDDYRLKLRDAVDFRKDFKPDMIENPTILIHSRALQQALRTLVDYYPSHTLTGQTILIDHPYKVLMHYYHELQAFKNTHVNFESTLKRTDDASLHSRHLGKAWDKDTAHDIDKDTAHDIGVLIKYLTPEFRQNIEPELQRHLQPQPVATYSMLWLLFKPGEDVYRVVNGKYVGFVVQSTEHKDKDSHHGRERARDRYNRCVVTVWNLAYRGQGVFRETHKYSIIEFQGEREIISLDIFPSKFLDKLDGNNTRRHLEKRGQQYYELIKKAPTHMSYTGNTERNSPLVSNNRLPQN
jgi:hypothetical protein